MAGISRVNYSSIENGSAGVSYEMVQRLARTLELNEAEALMRAGFNPGIMEEIGPALVELLNLPEPAQKMVIQSMLAQIDAVRKMYSDQKD